MECIIHLLKEVEPTLTKSEMLIASAIINSPDIVVSMNIVEFALFAGSSTASVSRLCRKLKLASFADLRIEIAKYLAMKNSEGEENVNDGDNEVNLIDTTIKALNDLKRLLNKELIDQCVDVINNANQILLSGQGASGFGATDFKYKLLRLGIRCIVEEDEDLEKVIVSSFDKDDVLILFSYSGLTERIINLVHSAKKQGATVIAITKTGKSPLSASADIVLQVPSCENSFRESATKSRILQLMIVDILFQALIESKDSSYKTLLKTWDAVNQGKKR